MSGSDGAGDQGGGERIRRSSALSSDDLVVWRHVVSTVRPMPGRVDAGPAAAAANPPSTGAPPVAPPVRPGAPTPAPTRHHPPAGAGQGAVAWLSQGDTAGIDRRTAERFRRGRLPVETRLDLHGMTQAHALEALRHCLDAAWRTGVRTVLVITGKGARVDGGIGVLRAAVPVWLNEPDMRPKVLSYAYAQQRDGGEGALYILIRRRRETSFPVDHRRSSR